jgi:hypothetical protein
LVTGCDKDEDLIKCCDESSGGCDTVKPNLVPHPKSPPNMGIRQGVVSFMGKLITLPTFCIQWKVHVGRKMRLDPKQKKCVFLATIFHVRNPYLKNALIILLSLNT